MIGAQRARVQALDDSAVLQAARDGDEWAWLEFAARARAVLEAYARRVRLPPEQWPAVVDEVPHDVARRIDHPTLPLPVSLVGYLRTAAALRRRRVARGAQRERRRQSLLARDAESGAPRTAGRAVGRVAEREPPVVLDLCSAYARRAATSPFHEEAVDDSPAARAARRLVARLAERVREADLDLLAWHHSGATHRELADALGISYAAAAKRVQRIAKRVDALAFSLIAEFPPDERDAIVRLRRRGRGECDGPNVHRGMSA